MRAISLVKKIEFEFIGNVARNALTLGDVDNDGHNEFIIGNDLGEVTIFKDKEKFQTITELSFVACLTVGDIRNCGKNSLVIVTSDGWCYIYEIPANSPNSEDLNLEDDPNTVIELNPKETPDEIDGQTQSASSTVPTETQSSSESTNLGEINKEKSVNTNLLVCVHRQRIPANAKTILLGDIDEDGQIEMVLGLTDRVVRSYRFIVDLSNNSDAFDPLLLSSGTLIALNKWECANQIGSITLHHGLDGKPSILVAQPGGTFMRIRCQMEEFTDKDDKPSRSELFQGLVDYQSLGISRMRNQNISTEIIGDLIPSNNTENNSRPYAIATLDGTIMLIQNEIILWAIAVDHQIFAITKLDITGNGIDDIIVCSWDGQTYILDQNKNSVRFHLEEPVRAFHSGMYKIDQCDVSALVYLTFKNTIIIYYDIPLKDLICKKFEPDLNKLSELFIDNNTRNAEEALEYVKNMDKKVKGDLVKYLLYES